jgi:hypothetical protein
MTFVEAVTELCAKHPKADLSPSVKRGNAFTRGPNRFQERQGWGVRRT